MAQGTTREPNNQAGLDASFDQVSKYVQSPQTFQLQRKRDIYHRRDGSMHGNAHENRFVKYNDTTIVNSKFAKYQSPAFEKFAVHSLDEYIRNYSNCKDENANHQAYYPEYSLVQKDLSAGIPNFDRYISKD